MESSEITKQENSLLKSIYSIVLTHDSFALAILILLNLICYGRTLNGYFLADDFIHVAYLNNVFDGQPLKLLENFTGNWMNAWGTQFYRPLISLTLAVDFLIGKGAALPFHLSNTIFHIAGSFFLFLATRRLLFGDFGSKQASLAAFAAAIFFTLCPLHTEVVSWIIGRVDGVCLAFFLAAFFFFLKSKQDCCRTSLSVSLACFAGGLLSKEMAVVLPPLVVLTSFFLNNDKQGFKQRVICSLQESALFWAALAAYFLVRFLALGTATGGYGGSVGEGLASSLLERSKSVSKFLFPFNQHIIFPGDRLRKWLLYLYAATGTFALARFTLLREGAGPQLKWLAYCIVWFVLSLLPAYQVFNITDSLSCSRFAYFATVPFSLFLAILISPAFEKEKDARRIPVKSWLGRLAVVLMLAYAFVLASICIKNNSAWARAGSHLRQFRSAVAEAAQKTSGNIILLNIPQTEAGAHMIYNAAMLGVLFSEPLTKPAIAKRVISFEPATYGDADLINVSRLRKLLTGESGASAVFYWDANSKNLEKIKLENENRPEHVVFNTDSINRLARKTKPATAIVLDSPELNIESLGTDFIICRLKFEAGSFPPNSQIRLSWSSKQSAEFSVQKSISLPLENNGDIHTYYFPVSEHKSWIAGETINKLRLELPPCSKPELLNFESLELVPKEELMPDLNPAPGQLAEGLDGIYRPTGKEFEIVGKSNRIPGSKSILLEVSKANSWFEHYTGTHRDQKESPEKLFSRKESLKPVSQGTISFKLNRSDFTQPAYYQLRVFVLDECGKVIGFSSDPLNLQIN